jgi:hypothetical protein
MDLGEISERICLCNSQKFANIGVHSRFIPNKLSLLEEPYHHFRIGWRSLLSGEEHSFSLGKGTGWVCRGENG